MRASPLCLQSTYTSRLESEPRDRPLQFFAFPVPALPYLFIVPLVAPLFHPSRCPHIVRATTIPFIRRRPPQGRPMMRTMKPICRLLLTTTDRMFRTKNQCLEGKQRVRRTEALRWIPMSLKDSLILHQGLRPEKVPRRPTRMNQPPRIQSMIPDGGVTLEAGTWTRPSTALRKPSALSSPCFSGY